MALPVLPTSKTPSAAPQAEKAERSAACAPGGAPALGRPPSSAPLRPIGPERLKALRQAIREGSYPTDADVLGGLENLLQGRRRRR
jgi:anti-sigma28 factor (negative regulator of flagellin synthesis)